MKAKYQINYESYKSFLKGRDLLLRNFSVWLCVLLSPCLLSASVFDFWRKEDLQAQTEKRHFKEQNKYISKKNKRFLLIQKASSVYIQPHPEYSDLMVLTLEEPDTHIAFYKVQPNRNFGMLTIKKYMWYCKLGRAMFSDDNVRGAMGHLSSSDSKDSPSHVFELHQPTYDKKRDQLIYEISALPGFELKDAKLANAILTIDLSLK